MLTNNAHFRFGRISSSNRRKKKVREISLPYTVWNGRIDPMFLSSEFIEVHCRATELQTL